MRGGCRRRQFLAIWVAISSETSEIRPAILYDDMLPLVDLWLIAKWMTLSDLEWQFHVKTPFRPAFLTQSVWLSKITNIDPSCQRQKYRPRSVTLVSLNRNYFDIFEGVSCRSVFKPGLGRLNQRINSFPAAISSYVSEMSSLLHLTATIWYRFHRKLNLLGLHSLFSISACTNKDDLEWPWMANSS